MLEIPRIDDASDVIPMDENAEIISALLDAAYPDYGARRVSMWESVSRSAEEIVVAAEKYDMPGVTGIIRIILFA